MASQLAQPKHRARRWLKIFGLLAVFLGVTMWVAVAIIRTNLQARYPAPGQLLEVDGYKMHLYCTGQGTPTVILAAGLDDFSIMWSLVQPDVARNMRVCSYDRAGLGWSDPSNNPRTIEKMLEELHTLLLNAGEAPPYVLVGHSFGGALVRLYADIFPDEVTGMVLVDAAPDDLFLRIPQWQTAINGKLGLYRTLAPLGSFGLLSLVPDSIPNRGMPEGMLAQYRAVAVSTNYFQTGMLENEAFEENLAEVRAANVNLGNKPLVVISRGYWDPMPGFSEGDNQQAQQIWQEMQSELLSLSSRSRQIMATKSEHNIQLQQPQLVIDAIDAVVEASR